MPRILRILHRTEYRYDRQVTLNPHKLMLRPRDGHDLWVDDAFLTVKPQASLRWYFDTFGNSIAEATFADPTDVLVIESELLLRRYVTNFLSRLAGTHICPYPFTYSDDDTRDLYPFLGMETSEDLDTLEHWLDRIFLERPEGAFLFLQSLSDAIHRNISYSSREEMGTLNCGADYHSGRRHMSGFCFFVHGSCAPVRFCGTVCVRLPE